MLAATPIGEVTDASPRFVAALGEADIIAAEDTRRLIALAKRLGVHIYARILSLHDHNETGRAQGLVDLAARGSRVLLVSDAGMPTVSDPGFRVVRAAVEGGVPVSVLPGPSAPITALAVSGLPSDRFSFEGFLPRKEGEARAYLADLATDPHTLIFFESPKRLHETLMRMAQAFGGSRQAVVCRELTKIHEEILRGDLDSLVEQTMGEVLGEITIVVAGARDWGSADDHVDAVLALAAEGMRLKDAASEVAEATGLRKNELYKAALRRKVNA
ncbi:16S rRNA (cytidine(1402)-2'-O)-methyltransferase [Actinomyces mediterranea]|uniref:16S rRNA (cytidine(1402)-2'-O)-methyltransferase n=1 Tax=Actinomyces mediterranea TaxID=1871028 RepID=UPI0009711FA7|nr:16S rRNA (cytidine(1402)-2'-O)-methyltransferase [Actinomyces mediterranea]